jgi:hypothetical protein
MLRIIPQVQEITLLAGEPLRRPAEGEWQVEMARYEPRIVKLLNRLWPGRPLRIREGGSGFALRIGPDRGERTNRAAKEQGYTLRIDGMSVQIEAESAAGLFYGIHTFAQILDNHDRVPALEIRDWPDTAMRCMHFDFRQTFSRKERLLDAIAAFARYKVNGLLIEYEDKFPFRNYAELTHPDYAFTVEELERMQRTAYDHFIEVIPLQQTFGHLEYVLRREPYKRLREQEDSTGEICPSKPESYALVTGLLREMIELHPQSRYIHLGCDEVYRLCVCPDCRAAYGGSKERTFIDFLNRLIAFTADHGKIPIFWHDMLDQCPVEELAKLDPRARVMIWLYNGRNIDEDATRLAQKFRAAGVEVMGAPAVRCWDERDDQNYPNLPNRIDNIRQWVQTAERNELACLVGTNWTGAFSLGVPYGIFETTWYPMLFLADLSWNRRGNAQVEKGTATVEAGAGEAFIDRFLVEFHGVEPALARAAQGNYRDEDYYAFIWKLADAVGRNRDIAEWLRLMREYEVAVDKSRTIHKYIYRLALFPGDEAERRSLLNNYRRTFGILDRIRPLIKELLLRFQPEPMADHYVMSRYYLHDFLERHLYQPAGLHR